MLTLKLLGGPRPAARDPDAEPDRAWLLEHRDRDTPGHGRGRSANDDRPAHGPDHLAGGCRRSRRSRQLCLALCIARVGDVTGYAARRSARTGMVLWRASSPGTEQHIAPDGVMDLMWFQGRLVVAGADTRSMVVKTQPGEVTWGLRLAPGVARALLDVPADDLTDQRVDLSELVASPNVVDAPFEDDVPAALEQVFVALRAKADPDRADLRFAASLDRAAREGLTVRETAARHDLSERSLRRLSNSLFGYGPKTLMQIHRFQRALHLVRTGKSLSDAAAAADYVDQAHFARESRRLTGQTPSGLIRAA